MVIQLNEFVRGDKYIDDGAIKKAFLRVKNQTNIKSEDKWNPADIWLVRKKKKIAEVYYIRKPAV